MPHLCCVPFCKGNYPGQPKVSCFSFPKDPQEQEKWIRAIKRENFRPTKASRVCELHFQRHEIERVTSFYVERTGELLTAPLKIPRLAKGVIPNQLPGCPTYLSQAECSYRESPSDKKAKRESILIQKALEESVESATLYETQQSLTSLEDIFNKFNQNILPGWHITKTTNYVCFIHIVESPLPSIIGSASIDSNFNLTFNYHNVIINSIGIGKNKVVFPTVVDTVNKVKDTLTKILDYFIKIGSKLDIQENINLATEILSVTSKHLSEEKQQAINFITEQTKLIPVISKNTLRYSWETLLFCSLLQSISPQAYNFLRNSNLLVLPSTKTLKSICSSFKTDPSKEEDEHFLRYASAKFKHLGEDDKVVVLMLDEIHLQPFLDFKGGSIVGNAHNSKEVATGAHVFMLNSLKSSYKEVVHILPVQKVKAEFLHEVLKKVILGLEDIGFEILVVATDNHALNRKVMSLFENPPQLKNLYTHPKDPLRPLFYIVDTVHILKNIRNNWINLKLQDMVYPDFNSPDTIKVASFDALKQLHSKEQTELLKYGYTLSLKALYPTSIERQNVKLVLQIFNQVIVTALRELGPKVHLTNFEDTATYIEIINRWWDVVNVKTRLKGLRSLNEYQQAVTKNSVHILKFLEDFLNWLNSWQTISSDKGNSGKLTKDTHLAITHTTDALIKIATYLLNEKGFNYVLLGNLQTDRLEERFGKYRYLSGTQYHVCLRQIFESEKKLRMQSIVPMIIKSKLEDIKITKEDIESFINQDVDIDSDNINENEIPLSLRKLNTEEICLDNISNNVWPSLIYISGFGAHSIIKKYNCEYCKFFLTEDSEDTLCHTSLITSNNRGGLSYPSESLSMCAAYTYVTLQNLLKDEENFLKQVNIRNIVIKLTLENISNSDINLFLGFNCRTHKVNNIIKSIVKTTTNTLLKNYVKKRNDVATTKTMPHVKRFKPNEKNK